jgi:hypothetical protein
VPCDDVCRVDTKYDEMKVSRKHHVERKKEKKNVVCGEAIHDGNAERPVVRVRVRVRLRVRVRVSVFHSQWISFSQG